MVNVQVRIFHKKTKNQTKTGINEHESGTSQKVKLESEKVKDELKKSKEDLKDLRIVKIDSWLKFYEISRMVLQVSEIVRFIPLMISL